MSAQPQSEEDKERQRNQRKVLAAQAFQSQLDTVIQAVQGTEHASVVRELENQWDSFVKRFPTLADTFADNDKDAAVTTGTTGTTGTSASSDTKEEEVLPPKPDYVTRYEIREMSREQQNRFFDAVDTMMKTKDGVPGTSEFFRCASYHGNPPPIYCKHGRESFPGWHRIYLLDFEKNLQAADRANGNDGNIGLPYWDWTIRPEDGLPSIIRERFNQWPDDLFPTDMKETKPVLSRNDDSTIAGMIRNWGVINVAQDCLLSTQHFAHASTGGEWASDYPSVEAPHNYMHVIVGGNGGVMGAVAWAAFDIAFWLHHCQVDRIYETYIQMEPDSKDEYEWTQKQMESRNGTNVYTEPFEPFLNAEGKPYYPADTFDIKKLGFVYNTPFPAPKLQQLRAPPTVALFPNVKVNEFESRCYQIHVYVVPANEEEKFEAPTNISQVDFNADNYAGGSGVFGRGMECENCQSRLPYDIVVDISKTLIKLRLSRYDARLKVFCLDTTETTGALIPVSDTPLPNPSITGPLFEDTESGLDQEHKDNQNSEEVRALQRYLERFGYYEGAIDGSYGPKTEESVKTLQDATGILKIDGLAGKKTKRAIRDLRRCSNKDPFADNNIVDNLVEKVEVGKLYGGKKNITYNIGVVPGYLYRRAVQECIRKSFDLWSDGLNGEITFEELPALGDEAKADIYLSFSTEMIKEDDNLMRFDGVGGILGNGGLKDGGNKGFVQFDLAERWVIGFKTRWNRNEGKPSDLNNPNTWYRGQPTISLFYTATHEIGHTLGLDHSRSAKDMMSPWYDPNKTSLTANDKARVKAQFGIA